MKWYLAFYIGGMGAKSQNFHLNWVGRLGFAEAGEKIQELFLAGKREEAVAAVPNELADEIALLGPPARIRDRLQAWRESPVTTMLVGTRDPDALRVIAEAM